MWWGTLVVNGLRRPLLVRLAKNCSNWSKMTASIFLITLGNLQTTIYSKLSKNSSSHFRSAIRVEINALLKIMSKSKMTLGSHKTFSRNFRNLWLAGKEVETNKKFTTSRNFIQNTVTQKLFKKMRTKNYEYFFWRPS